MSPKLGKTREQLEHAPAFVRWVALMDMADMDGL